MKRRKLTKAQRLRVYNMYGADVLTAEDLSGIVIGGYIGWRLWNDNR